MPYMIIPMTRLLDNTAVLPNNTLPAATSDSQDPLDEEYNSPYAPEEPQIGFRFNAPAEARYQEAMRYGRRSKLELLWRMGAIPLSKGLHEKKIAWEKEDLQYITAQSHGQLRRAGTSQGGQPEAPFEEGPGWVHRLFSGMREQEESSDAALQLRRVSRMKGIVAYLEKLDEQAARIETGGCSASSAPCSFRKDRLWNWDSRELADLKREARSQAGGAAFLRVKAFEDRTTGLLGRAKAQLAEHSAGRDEAYWARAGPVDIARTAARLALVGYLTSNTSYAEVAAQLIKARFLDLHPHHHDETLSEHLLDEHTYAGLDAVAGSASRGTAGSPSQTGYAFPSFPESKHHLWQRSHMPADAQDFPYDALAFKPSLLLDALRLLGPAYQPNLHIDALLPPQAIRSLFSRHLAGLLLSAEGLQISAHPRNAEQAAQYDASVASLAAFLDDVKLLGRVLDRHRVRYVDAQTGDPATAVGEDEQAASVVRARMINSAGGMGYPVKMQSSRAEAGLLDLIFGL